MNKHRLTLGVSAAIGLAAGIAAATPEVVIGPNDRTMKTQPGSLGGFKRTPLSKPKGQSESLKKMLRK